MNTWRLIFEWLFSLTLFIKAALFIPQIWRIIQRKDVQALSVTTFLSMNAMQILMIIHAYLRGDKILMGGIALSLLTSGTVTFLILYYRFIHE